MCSSTSQPAFASSTLSTSRPSVLSRVPTEIWELILSFSVSLPLPPGYLIHPPSPSLSGTIHPGTGAFTLSPFTPPQMHWDGLRSSIACTYSDKLAAIRTRRRLAQVSRAFRKLSQRLPVWRTNIEWLVVPMDMDARHTIIALAEDRPFGRVGRLVRRLEFLPGAENAGMPTPWRNRPDEGLLRRIIGHCTELEEMWCGVYVSNLTQAVVNACGKTLRTFSYSEWNVTTRDVYSLLAHCPKLEVLRFTYVVLPSTTTSGTTTTPTEEPFLAYGSLPPLALHTLAFCLSEACDALLGWMSTLQMPHLKYLKIERDFRRTQQPGPDNAAAAPEGNGDDGGEPDADWPVPPLVPLPAAAALVPTYMHAWQPHLTPIGTLPPHPPAGLFTEEPPLPPGLAAFFHSHGQGIETLEVLETFDPLLLLPSLGWALLALCPNAQEFVTCLPGAAYGVACVPRSHSNLRRVGCYGFWIGAHSVGFPGIGEEEEDRRTRTHLENVLDAVIGLIGGDVCRLELIRFFDVQKGRVSARRVHESTEDASLRNRGNSGALLGAGRTEIGTVGPFPLDAVTNPVSNPRPLPSSLPSPLSDERDDSFPQPEHAKTLRTIRDLCAANGVRFEDAQGELVGCWPERRLMWRDLGGVA